MASSEAGPMPVGPVSVQRPDSGAVAPARGPGGRSLQERGTLQFESNKLGLGLLVVNTLINDQ